VPLTHFTDHFAQHTLPVWHCISHNTAEEFNNTKTYIFITKVKDIIKIYLLF